MTEDNAKQGPKPEARVGSYRVVATLGSGGMSSVYRAIHADSGHEVALKILPRSLAKNPTTLQRFLREAKNAEALQHPNIVTIYDCGVDQGRHYLALEYVAGGDLNGRVRSQGPFPVAEAIAVVRGVAEGLRYASSRGVIHRDVKPANILMTPSGLVKIIDLGLALQSEGEDERVTRDGTTVGTVDYMAPEQARDSRGAGIPSDIYSLGCTFYFLLTGSPPYPGGDIADKLGRHCTQPPADPRKVDPKIPDKVAALVMKMMAKKPEKRFADYEHLIAALDALTTPNNSASAPLLDAIIDDDDEPAAMLDAIIDDDDEPVATLDALIAEDSDDDLPTLPAARTPDSRAGAGPSLDPLPMADLAGFDEPPKSRSMPTAPRPVKPAASRPELSPSALLDEGEEPEEVLAGGRAAVAAAVASSRAYQAGSMKWVKRCAVIGVGIVLFVIGVDQFVKSARGPIPVVAGEGEEADIAAASEVVVAPSGPNRPTVVKKKAAPEKVAERPQPKPWTEPKDPAPESIPEPDLGSLEAKFVPSWAAEPIPDRLPGPFTTVRRVLGQNSSDKTTLRQGMDVIGGTVEIADDGPFFEDDLRVVSETRLIRARTGFRPIICVEEGKIEIVRSSPGVVVLEGKHLLLDGIDLVIRVDELPKEQSALFYCKGGSLTLRNCTVTVQNPKKTPFAVVRTAGASKPSHIRVERTFIRGAATTVFDLAGGPTDVFVSRSVLLGGAAPPATSSELDPSAERRITVLRSIVASKAPFLELTGAAAGARPKPVVLRAVGSTFACIAGAVPSSIFDARERAGGPADLVRWEGDHNVFTGWKAWLSTGNEHAIKVADLAAARQAWPGTDAKSLEARAAWADFGTFERVVPLELRPLAPTRLAVLSRVAAPTPFLPEKTFASFDRPKPPALAADLFEPPKPPTPPVTPRVAPNPFDPHPKAPPPAPPPPLPEGFFYFDAAAPPWNGDLGLFLRGQRVAPGQRIKVYAWGTGEHALSPVRMPYGVSLEIVVDPRRSPGPPLTWKAETPTTTVDALIDVRGGDLVLSGVNLFRDGSSGLKALTRVEGGHLILSHCRLKAPGSVEAEGGGLVEFHAPTTQPFQAGRGPFAANVDRPVCFLTDSVLITGGDALTAEVGRGLIVLTHCAIASGGTALTLSPATVARSRFFADLTFDHCTLASEKNFVKLGPWRGSAPGPDRPWVTNSQDSAFVVSYAGGGKDGVLVRSLGDSISRGVLFWQGRNDAYEVPHFTAGGESPPGPNARVDVRRQWLDLWGRNHFRGATGPGKVGVTSSVRFVERLKPGDVAEKDLVLDPNVHRDRRKLDVGASPARLGLPVPPVRK